jgi:hypothetical protein
MTLYLIATCLLAASVILTGGVTVALLFLYLLSRTERHLPPRQQAERAEPVNFRAALHVRDRTRRGPTAEDFQGKTKIGRAA